MGIARGLVDNYQKRTQFNTVVSSQEEMDRAGFEPTINVSYYSDPILVS
jgi:hypothetical protein